MKIFNALLALTQALAELDTAAWLDLPLSLLSSAQSYPAVSLYQRGVLLKRGE